MSEIDNRYRILRPAFFLCLILSALVLFSYLSQAKPASLLAALARFNPFFLLLGFLAVLLSWVVEGLRVYLIADALGERVPLWRMIRINIATSFSGNVVPMASMAAPPTQVFLLHREGIPVGKATAIVAMRTASSTLFYTIGAPILFLGFGRAFVRGITSNLALSATVQTVLVISSVVALTTLAILLRPQLAARVTSAAFSLRLTRRLLGSRGDRIAERVANEAQAFHESLDVLFRSRRDAALTVLLTFVYWALYFAVAPLLLLGVGMPLGLRGTVKLMVFLFLTYFLLSYLPIPTGSGVSELSFGSILHFFAVPDPIRTVILIVWSFLCVQIYTLLGGAFFLGALRRRRLPAGGAGLVDQSAIRKR
ncbi:MAG: lysylphosphatidylglycerol synthase transmembrane domain-containing protein [Bacteroidota bacterium]